jgi:mannose-6-phosphate isomerase-like protein (cupin superfamily)
VSWQTRRLSNEFDALAPDGSEIRLLAQVSGGSMVHCTLAPGAVTRAVRHRSVEELWFCVAGTGQLWRRAPEDNREELVTLEPGVSVSIPLGTEFQFRAEQRATLELVITTMPPWPGEEEAVPVTSSKWRPTL